MKYLGIGIAFAGIGIGAGLSAFAGVEPNFNDVAIGATVSFVFIKLISAIQGTE